MSAEPLAKRSGGDVIPRRMGDAAFALLLGGFVGTVLVSSSIAPTAQRALLVALLLGGAALEALGAALERRRPGLLASPAALAVSAGCGIAGVTGPAFFDCHEQLVWWLALAVGGAALASLCRSDPRRRAAIAALLATLTLATLHGLAQSLYLYDLLREGRDLEAPAREYAGFLGSRRARSTFGQANGFASFLLTLLPLSLLALRGRARLVVFAAALLALVASASYGGFLVAIGVLGATAAACGRRGVAVALGATFGVGLLTAAVGPLLGLELETLRLRYDYWGTAMRVGIDALPSGVGAAMHGWAAQALAEPSSWSRYPHQALLALFAETGVIGLGVVAVLAWRFVVACRDETVEVLDQPGRAAPTPALVVAALSSVAAPAMHFADLPAPWATAAAVGGAGIFLVVASRWLVARLDGSRIGIACAVGIAGFTFHAMVDFDLYVPGALASATALAAVWRPAPERAGTAIAGFAAALVLAAVSAAWTIRALEVVQTEALCDTRIAAPLGVATGDRATFTERVADPARSRVRLALGWAGHLHRVRRTELARRVLEPWGPVVLQLAPFTPSDRPR